MTFWEVIRAGVLKKVIGGGGGGLYCGNDFVGIHRRYVICFHFFGNSQVYSLR